MSFIPFVPGQILTAAELNAALAATIGPYLPLVGGEVTGGTLFSGAGTGLAVTNNATIGGTLGVTGATNLAALAATGAITGAGFTARFASPGPIGSTTPSTLSATTGAFSGATSVTGGGPLGFIVQNTGANGGAAYASATIRTTGASGSGLGPGLYLDARSLPSGREYVMFSGGPGDGAGVGAGGLGLLDVSSGRLVQRFDTSGNAVFPQTVTGASLIAGNHKNYILTSPQGLDEYAFVAVGAMSGVSSSSSGFDFAAIVVESDTVNASPNFGGTNWFHVNGNVGAPMWQASHSYPTLNVIANNGGRIYKVVTTGTSAGSGGPTGTGTNIVDGTVHWDFVSADFSGSRAAVQVQMNIQGRNDPAITNDSMRQWPAIIGSVSANANQGGTAPNSGLSAGAAFAIGGQAFLFSGATNFTTVTGAEFDVGIFTGASSAARTGVLILGVGDVQGGDVDVGLQFAVNQGTPGFRKPISIYGGYSFPVDTTSWFMSYEIRIGIAAALATYATPTMAGLIDGSGMEYSTAFLRTTGGMSVGPTGSINAQSAVISTTGAITSIDTTGGELNTAIISFAGAAYKVGDHIFDPVTGTIINVTTIGGGGNITGTSIVTRGHYTASPPANPVPMLGGTGNGLASMTLTWTAATTLSLQPTSGGLLRVGPSVMTANGSVATALSSVGPAGANTTVQEWFTVRNSSGTVRYIPAF